MESTRFSLLTAPVTGDACVVLDLPDNLSTFYLLRRGVRVGAAYPDGFPFRMSAAVFSPKVTDVIPNALGLLMITERLKDLFEAHAAADIEYLRFTLLNHKGRAAPGRFYIANVVGGCDCADAARTTATPHPLFPGEAQFVERLCWDEGRIPEGVRLVRLSLLPRAFLVRDDLRRLLEGAGITGAVYEGEGEVQL